MPLSVESQELFTIVLPSGLYTNKGTTGNDKRHRISPGDDVGRVGRTN